MDSRDDPRQWLVAVCRQAREDAGMNRTVIAGKVNKGEDVVRRFETLRGKWSPLTGQLVAAYADAAGVPVAELWQMAIRDWKAAQAQASDDQAPGIPPKVPKAPRPASQKSPAKRRQGAGS